MALTQQASRGIEHASPAGGHERPRGVVHDWTTGLYNPCTRARVISRCDAFLEMFVASTLRGGCCRANSRVQSWLSGSLLFLVLVKLCVTLRARVRSVG